MSLLLEYPHLRHTTVLLDHIIRGGKGEDGEQGAGITKR